MGKKHKIRHVDDKRPRGPHKSYEKGFKLKPATKPNPNENFYETRHWHVLRYKALLYYGKICMCCGKSGNNIQVDHIKPRARYPELQFKFENLQVLCARCKTGKDEALDETDFRSGKFTPKSYDRERKF